MLLQQLEALRSAAQLSQLFHFHAEKRKVRSRVCGALIELNNTNDGDDNNNNNNNNTENGGKKIAAQ